MSSNDRFDEPNYQYGRWLSSPPPGEEVVISGMSGRLPESIDINEFHNHLLNKDDMVTDDNRRWDINHPEIPRRFSKIRNIDKFDPGYFGVSHQQANQMNPDLRFSMEVVIEAIMDAGINPNELKGTKTGIFLSAALDGLQRHSFSTDTPDSEILGMSGYLHCILVDKISHYLKIKGPACVMDTACSSSMIAFDAAFKAVRSGVCDNALVATCHLIYHPAYTLQFFRLGVLSFDGRCKVFDEEADGYARGETIACLFLQKAKNARRVYAKIVNVKVNQDGYKEQGISFPSSKDQASLMKEIYEESGVHPSQLSYLEVHGTGTLIGDPEEVEAIDRALAQKRRQELLVGSVKSNIGHTEIASGLCSIIKVLLAMESGVISPNINLKKVKESLGGIVEGRMKVVSELTELVGEEAIVGINNFGFGGSNVHIILKRNRRNKLDVKEPKDEPPKLVCASGRSVEAVQKLLYTDKMDTEYIGLLHQIFKSNVTVHPYRGFAVISKNGVETLSVNLASQAQFYMFFGKFNNNFRALGLYLSKFPIFQDTIKRINMVLEKMNVPPFDDTLKNKSEPQFAFVGAACVQIAVMDILKQLDLNPKAVYVDSSCKFLSEYQCARKSLEQAIFEKIKSIRYDVNFNVSEVKTENALIYERLKTLNKNNIILNISDATLNGKNVLMIDGTTVTFLEVLGKLYQNGHAPQLHKLYSKVEFPVSRGTPMISPLIKWHHDKSWPSPKFTASNKLSTFIQKKFKISFMFEDYKFISGHLIDGRNLFPATEYLHLVWQAFVERYHWMVNDVSVVFTNCKFLKAVTMPENGFVNLMVTIQRGSGYFEILEKNSIIVTGYINKGEEETCLQPVDFKEEDPTNMLQHEEIYRELNLRGYSYSGLFNSIQKFNLITSTCLIKWHNNWGAFMDNMLQMMILQTDSRLLFVPVGIKKITINAMKHLNIVDQLGDTEPLVPVYINKDANIVKSGGIEIIGLHAKSIIKRKTRLEPVLERSVFVDNFSDLSLQDAVRVNTQIVLENNSGNYFKAVEITQSKCDFILPLVSKVLDDIPMVVPDLFISSKDKIEEIPGVKIDNIALTSEHTFLLVIGTKLLERDDLKTVMVSLSNTGFILSREDIDCVPEHTTGVEIVTTYVTDKEKIVLFRQTPPILNRKFIEISSTDFGWIPELKTAISTDENVVLYSKKKLEGILGLVNCIRREPNGSKVQCFFTVDENLEFDLRNYKDQLRKNLAVNVFKSGRWGTYRHLLLEEEAKVECEHCYATTVNRGDISSLQWLETSLSEDTPLPNEKVFASVYYSALNFKDIMAALGRVPIEVLSLSRINQECLIGIEFSGRVLSGHRVFGMVDNIGLASQVKVDTSILWNVPESWTLEEAATVPIVYSTALYAFLSVGNLKRGSSVLIHSATGGVGLAALNVCLYYNCDIFVTVSTQEKRDYLKAHYPQILESHVGNSRDTTFEEMIKRETNNRGVDFVLNSLVDDKLEASVRCLAKSGCFLEIGKFNLANNTSLNLLFMEKGASYHGIMIDIIVVGSKEKKLELHRLLSEGIEAGYVKPLPRVVFKKEEIETSFRHMMTGKHIGKVLVKMRDEEKVTIITPKKMKFSVTRRFNCDVRFSYIIIGGLGGVGLELADWLVLRGAKKLILVSRAGIQSGYQKQRIRLWESYGIVVRVTTKDVTTKEGCSDLLKEATNLGPVDAIFNLAVVLKDALFPDQTTDSFLTSLAPKAKATEFLDLLTRTLCPQLRYFVVFSSVSCGRGNAGQTNYGMANSIMERICEKRKSEGLPAIAIQWGVIGDVGLVTKMVKENKELVIGGTLQQKISSCLEVLDRFLTQNNPIVSSMVVAEKGNKKYDADTPAEAIANILGIKDLKTVSLHSTLPELGMDSMMGTEIVQMLEKEFAIYVTLTEIRNLSLSKLLEMEGAETKKKEESSGTKTSTNIFTQYIPRWTNNNLPIVELNNKKSNTVAVLFPGFDGGFTQLQQLHNLETRLLGFQYYCCDFGETIQEFATNILPHIESIFENKKFMFIGYSFGANVALEVAVLLEKKGYTGKIILLEGSPNYLNSAVKSYYISQSEELDNTILLQTLSLRLSSEEILQLKGNFEKCKNFSEKLDIIVTDTPAEVLTKTNFSREAAVALHKRVKSIRTYNFSHQNMQSELFLIKAEYSLVEASDDYQLSEIKKPALIITVEGNHITMLNRPEICEFINKVIVSE